MNRSTNSIILNGANLACHCISHGVKTWFIYLVAEPIKNNIMRD